MFLLKTYLETKRQFSVVPARKPDIEEGDGLQKQTDLGSNPRSASSS